MTADALRLRVVEAHVTRPHLAVAHAEQARILGCVVVLHAAPAHQRNAHQDSQLGVEQQHVGRGHLGALWPARDAARPVVVLACVLVAARSRPPPLACTAEVSDVQTSAKRRLSHSAWRRNGAGVVAESVERFHTAAATAGRRFRAPAHARQHDGTGVTGGAQSFARADQVRGARNAAERHLAMPRSPSIVMKSDGRWPMLSPEA
eukprot:5758582-Prymnesium_polylepis.1